ncbi:hypothetical protein AM493_12285 [Flavobacterium akiainvivens]|uniref:Uncharacterized protein n=1 Tax=Flavobacterium akiainvivens TaxID=1202724 RepID=A0A0M9VII5_9FLAO|nr:hypothetical protein AM493_12285 [Flavobacterium akiainvivens]
MLIKLHARVAQEGAVLELTQIQMGRLKMNVLLANFYMAKVVQKQRQLLLNLPPRNDYEV